MFHYTSSGLSNIWLRDGYKTINTPYGKATSISDTAGLHRAIGRYLALEKLRLSGPEFRFLRKELELSQLALAHLMGLADAQALAKWEKQGRVARLPTVFICQFYLESVVKKNPRFTNLVKRHQAADEARNQVRLVFSDKPGKGWIAEAA